MEHRLLDKLTVTQLVKELPAFYGIIFTTVRHLSLFWGKWIQPTPSHPISRRSSL